MPVGTAITQRLPEDVSAAIRSSFARQGLMTTLGAAIDLVAPGHVEISLPLTSAVSQQHGYGHAGATFALGDSAAGYAALSLMPAGSEVLTVEMKINLVAPAAGIRPIAVGEVLKPGRRLSITRATVYSETAEGARTPCAYLQGTMIPG